MLTVASEREPRAGTALGLRIDVIGLAFATLDFDHCRLHVGFKEASADLLELSASLVEVLDAVLEVEWLSCVDLDVGNESCAIQQVDVGMEVAPSCFSKGFHYAYS